MYYMGIDVGSVSTDIVIVDKNINVVESLYLRTKGRPINAIQEGFKILKEKFSNKEIIGVGTTGSGRQISSSIIGADVVKNEITAHAVASLNTDNSVKTIIEIGGQDSKIILLDNGIVTDFAMNTVCAAGTGSFLDRQAERLEIPIEEFGDYALKSTYPVRIAGRCAVFAESDMIHKQQLGYSENDIIRGLCEALVRNYLNNVAKGKNIKSKIFFQGGVAANIGIKTAFENALGSDVTVPQNYKVMGAIGSAILAKEYLEKTNKATAFKGFDLADTKFVSKSFECEGCSNRCEVVKILGSKSTVGFFGDRCGKWSGSVAV
ncbi:acyl-CoA dehydratase activase [Clostridium magnum]|uniref:R-phenyllactate dehydratase activator n=1 Tax=Clostridium magnum DSM 2767 TaxID=1121326 RepID=A0A162SEV0_9CLOT|nr:acyl-CoA dehydratase activase [Clostridium magnum]KZL91151.1 R-phenyllactate dehydratase activator [Clostridium magnum DSM 2767]SHI17871.1 CoA-substrate-specific enzyme activase, putative [Clostridium magnum DSM 2767]